eukprot:snap_masked-scaffold_47-processed-gene-1.48-mRNA-1 protein AED:0.17 eAED:0.18 QI:0/-1/0/1/-1/1/1/0/636
MAEVKEGRDRWSSRVTFILGAIGSAVGLGNLWRFPFLVFNYGGGTFLIPYIFCLFGFGIPLLLLELTLGRHFQGGDPVCFASMNPRLVGIGFMSGFAAFIVTTYYAAIIAWVVVFFFNSFKDPLPWAILEEDVNTTGAARLGGAIGFFFNDVLEISAGPDVQEEANEVLVLAAIFVWVCIFLSIFKGVSTVSQVVKVSVPVPLATLAVLLINNLGREGASDGVEAYIGQWDLSALSDPTMWQNAVGQIFFSIGVCFAIMTAYSSYMESRKGLLLDTTVIALCNSGISFFAGFVVFTAVGALANDLGTDFDDPDFVGRIAGPNLAFVAYPAALASLGTAPQAFSAVFFLTVFFLAIDSAFSLVEASVATIADTNYGRTIPRAKLVGIVCVLAFSFGMFYIVDNGLYMLDIVDYYVNNILMLGVGALECIATAWVFGFSETAAELGFVPTLVFAIGTLVSTFGAAALLTYLDNPINLILGFLLLIVGTLVSLIFAMISSPPVPGKVYKFVYGCGASKIMDIMKKNEFDGGAVSGWYSGLIHVWAFLIKFLIPMGLIILTFVGSESNFEDPYEGYPGGWQNVGNFIAFTGWAIFGIFVVNKVEVYSEKVAIHEANQAALENKGDMGDEKVDVEEVKASI